MECIIKDNEKARGDNYGLIIAKGDMNAKNFVSDLDGTLLSGNKTLSAFSINTINALVDKGLLFSYATARSFVTARQVTSGLKSNIPVIINNGSFIVNSPFVSVNKLLLSYFKFCI